MTTRRVIDCRNILGALLLISSFLTINAIPAAAGVAFFTDEAEFVSINPGLSTQDFQSGNVAPGGDVLCSSIIDENTNDNCFSPGDILPGIQFSNDPPVNGLILLGSNFDNNLFNVLLTNDQPDDFEIRFTSNRVTAAGVDVGCLSMGPCNNTLTVSVFGSGDDFLGETSVTATNNFDSFIGIQSHEPITRIIISGPIQIFEGIDRISFGTTVFTNIPALSVWGLITISLALCITGLIYVRRRLKEENHS